MDTYGRANVAVSSWSRLRFRQPAATRSEGSAKPGMEEEGLQSRQCMGHLEEIEDGGVRGENKQTTKSSMLEVSMLREIKLRGSTPPTYSQAVRGDKGVHLSH